MQLSEHSTSFQAGCQGWRILHELTTTGKTTLSDKQVRQFIELMDMVADRLRPVRRPQDLDQPECSQLELRALAALGQRHTLTMSELAAILKVPLSTATHMIDKLVVKNLVERRHVKHDRRIVQVAFNKKGKRIHQFVLESRFASGRAMLAALNPRERRIVLQRISKMIPGILL
jgi:DNA-binding MarR family transcriptional regulator